MSSQRTFMQKISRERVGIEISKTLMGPNPVQALDIIFSMDMYYCVFADPSTEEVRDIELARKALFSFRWYECLLH